MAHSPVRGFSADFSRYFSLLPAAALLGAALLTAGCHPRVTDPKDPKFIVAEKGDWHVTRGDLDDQIKSYMTASHITPDQIGPEKMPMLETAMLDNIVLKKLILDKAAQLQLKDTDKEEADDLARLRGAATDQDFADHLKAANLTLDDLKKRIHEKVLIEGVLKSEVSKDAEPSDQEIDQIYITNKEHFVTPAQVRASRILMHLDEPSTPAAKINKKKAIDMAHSRVVHGEDFSKVATEVSEDRSSAPHGGDIGWFKKDGNGDDPFDDMAFGMKEGAVSPVFESPLGYEFLKVTGTQPAGVIPLADARAFIAGKLRQMKMQQLQEAYSKKLLAESGVKYNIPRAEMPANPGPAGPQPPNQGQEQPAPSPDQTAAPQNPTAPSTNGAPQ